MGRDSEQDRTVEAGTAVEQGEREQRIALGCSVCVRMDLYDRCEPALAFLEQVAV